MGTLHLAVVAVARLWLARAADDLEDLFGGQNAGRFLGFVDDPLGQFGSDRNAVGGEIVLDVGVARHGADLNLLRAADPAGGNAGVDAVGEPVVAALLGLDDGGGVDAGGGTKSIASDNGSVDGDGNTGHLGNELDVLGQAGEIVVANPQELEIDQQLFDGSVSDAFTDAEGGTVDAGDAGLDGGQGVGEIGRASCRERVYSGV